MNIMALTEQPKETFYDEQGAFSYYMEVWGGETIHIGQYDTKLSLPVEDDANAQGIIRQGGLLIMERLRSELPALDASSHVADLGSAYGQLSRDLARTYGCRVTCLDLASKMNAVNVQRTKEAQLDHLIEVITGDYTQSGLESASFDVIVSQDAFLHAGERREVLISELSRLLKPAGMLVFTDIMQADDADPEVGLSFVCCLLSFDCLSFVLDFSSSSS
mmetsp:Transcript_35749/g.89700  ORF Transcript_35749/g.89700 Transcript_35749/m.89700 type:complete len:219 (+) Transcript_35749:393-1049(+)